MSWSRSWLIVLACLIAGGAALAWTDALLLRPLIHDPAPALPRVLVQRQEAVPIFPIPAPIFDIGLGFRGRAGLGYGWVLATAAVLGVAGVIAALVAPGRVRNAVERLEAPGAPVVILVAGAVTALLVVTASLLLRYTFVLVGLAPLLWFATVTALVFGLAGLGVFAGRRLQRLIGGAPPLLASVAGVVLVLDLTLIPLAGWVFGALVAVSAIGLAVITRFGSGDGWSLDALDWPINPRST